MTRTRGIGTLLAVGLAAATMSIGACNKKESGPELPGPMETGKTGNNQMQAEGLEPMKAEPPAEPAPAVAPTTVQKARVALQPTKGSKVKGQLELTSEDGKVHITGEITGLKKGDHGFHIHEKGDCSGPDGKTAGDHFAPQAHPHGAPGGEGPHHAGDFGNIQADAKGKAKVDVWSELPLLTEGEQFVVGRAFIVHDGKDDLTSQPAGNAGARVACGVIEKSEG